MRALRVRASRMGGVCKVCVVSSVADVGATLDVIGARQRSRSIRFRAQHSTNTPLLAHRKLRMPSAMRYAVPRLVSSDRHHVVIFGIRMGVQMSNVQSVESRNVARLQSLWHVVCRIRRAAVSGRVVAGGRSTAAVRSEMGEQREGRSAC